MLRSRRGRPALESRPQSRGTNAGSSPRCFHLSFNFFRRMSERAGEVDEHAVLIYVINVFDSDAQFFFRNVHAWLNGEDSADGDWLLIIHRIVHVDAD